MKYRVVIERGETSYGAYQPELPGCISAGDTIEEVRQLIRKAIDFYNHGMKEDGIDVAECTGIDFALNETDPHNEEGVMTIGEQI